MWDPGVQAGSDNDLRGLLAYLELGLDHEKPVHRAGLGLVGHVIGLDHGNEPHARLDEHLGVTRQIPVAEQMKALDAYHRELEVAPEARKREMLRDGYMPGDPEVLIDAGLKAIPYLGDLHFEFKEIRPYIEALL